jgi:hypothetical protein
LTPLKTVSRYVSGRLQPGHRSGGGAVTGVAVIVDLRLVRFGGVSVPRPSGVADFKGSVEGFFSDCGP